MRPISDISMMERWRIAAGFFVLILTAVALSQSPWIKESIRFRERIPAAISKTYDFSNLRPDEMEAAIRTRLVHGLRALEKKDLIGLQAGHFVVRENGQPAAACAVYPKIVFHFIAEGSATSGNVPSMQVSGPCRVGENQNQILPLWIPMADVRRQVEEAKKQSSEKMELSFNENLPVHLLIEHVGSVWPSQWILQEVVLENPATSKSFHVDWTQIYQLTASSRLVLTW